MISMARMWRPLAWTLFVMLIVVTVSLESVHLQQSAALRLLADPTQSAALSARVLRLQSLSQALIVAALVLIAGLIACAAQLWARPGSARPADDAAAATLPADVAT